MDVAGEWTERIARRVAPGEASFAAEAGLAYAAGGRRRRDLLPRYSAEPGAFGPGGAAELPFILQALEQAYHALRDLLSSPSLGNTLAAASLLVAVRDSRASGHQAESATPSPAQPAPDPAGEKEAIEQAFDTLNERLRTAGFSPERATELTYELLGELLSDTAAATAYLYALSAVPSTSAPRRRVRIFRRADHR